jgi:hypothetical protein
MKPLQIVPLVVLLLPLLGAKPAPEIWVAIGQFCKDDTGAPAGTICTDADADRGVWVCPEPGPCGDVTPWVRTSPALHTSCTDIADVKPNTTYASRWRAGHATDITEIWCEADVGSTEMDLVIDDGTPLQINGSYISCTSQPGAVDSDFANSSLLAASDTLDIKIGNIDSAKTLSVCWRHRDD